MDYLNYIIIAVVLAVLFGPTLLSTRTPIPETSAKVQKITSSTSLTTLLNTTTFVILDFYADWCPPCRAIAPLFSKLADEHAVPGQIAFAKVNVDNVKDVAGKYGVTAMPTFLVFERGVPGAVSVRRKGGEEVEVERIKGADQDLLRALVTALAERVGKTGE